MQFLIGVTYAGAHSFISYSIPVQVLTTATSPALSSISYAATAVASSGYGTVLKKYLLRAAAEEGLAENVIGADSAVPHQESHGSGSDIPKYHTEYQAIHCIDTSGQTFAIWLNVLYLMPLTVLFVRFFIKSYIRRTSKAGGRENRQGQLEKAGLDALKGIERELNETENGHGNNVLRERSNGHAKANWKANGSARMNGDSQELKSGRAVLKDSELKVKGGEAIMKMT
jgi:hypothetical protein